MDVSIDQKLKAIELATNSMYYETIYDATASSNGYRSSTLRHKDMREIFRRADRFLAYATGTEEADTKGLINKLRDVLCSKE